MDYPAQSRLKILDHIENPEENASAAEWMKRLKAPSDCQEIHSWLGNIDAKGQLGGVDAILSSQDQQEFPNQVVRNGELVSRISNDPASECDCG